MTPPRDSRTALNRHIEEASLNAWPARQQTLFDGWIVRFAAGYTKRANSVNPLFPSRLKMQEKIEACEALYAARCLPTTFRLTPFAPPELDPILGARGYDRISPTLVLQRNLQEQGLPSPSPRALPDVPLDDWLSHFCRLKSMSAQDRQTLGEIVRAIPGTLRLASLVTADQVIACGMGVLERGLFGLFNVVTAPACRNRGHGTALILALLDWARQQGAQHAYLQVERGNTPARRLYEKLGFERAYAYWYRVRQVQSGGHHGRG